MTAAATHFDRAAAVRRALRTLVASNGLHGASMSAVAKQAGVATGTAYVHYASKDELIFATYLEIKREMGESIIGGIDPTAAPHDRFVQLWLGTYRFLAAEPERARFMVQLDSSPYARAAHDMAMAADGDPIMAEATATDMVAHLVPLDLEILYDLGLGPAIRMAARATEDEPAIDDATATVIAESCWRAIAIG